MKNKNTITNTPNKVDHQTDLTGNYLIINDNCYHLLKMDAPKHLPGYKPLANLKLTGTYAVSK